MRCCPRAGSRSDTGTGIGFGFGVGIDFGVGARRARSGHFPDAAAGLAEAAGEDGDPSCASHGAAGIGLGGR